MTLGKVFLAYDELMTLHRPRVETENVEDPDFVHERPSRLLAVYMTLMQLEDRMMAQQYLDLHPGGIELIEPTPGELTRRFIPLKCTPAPRDAICRVHSEEHYEFMESTSRMSEEELDELTRTSEDLYFCKETFNAARLAVGGCIHAVNAVTAPFRVSRRAMCLVRPPAHHAVCNAAMGFCYFNNIVVAAKHALHTKRASRVFILDWDVHHGNGVQDLTYDDPNIFYFSIHRGSSRKHWFYPDSGRPEETGAGSGVGTNANIALERGGMGNKEYAAAFSELVLPAMTSFEPDMVIIACGADAAEGDLLGDCGLTPEMYYIMTKSVIEAAGVDTPLITVLEGGYNLPVLSDCLQAVNIAMLDEPFESWFKPSQPKEQKEMLKARELRALNCDDDYWSLTRYWDPDEKDALEGLRTSHPEKGLTKRALIAIKRAARSLAFSQSRQGAFNCIQNPTGFVCAHDACPCKTGFRRLHMLDLDRYPSTVPAKRARLSLDGYLTD